MIIRILFICVLWSCFLWGEVRGDEVLSSDFTGRTVNGNTAETITWVTNGIAAPGDLTAIDVNSTGDLAGLHDTTDSSGHFAPNLNVGNEGPWQVDIPLAVASGYTAVTITNVTLDWQQFNNSGNFQVSSYSVDWTVTIRNASSAVVGAVTNRNVNGNSGITRMPLPASIELSRSETYTLEIHAVGSTTTGNNTGLDALILSGTAEFGPPTASITTIK